MITFGQLSNKLLIDNLANDYGKIVNMGIMQNIVYLITDKHTLSVGKIASIGDIVTAREVAIVDDVVGIIGKPTYTAQGLFLGQVVDCTMTATAKARHIVTNHASNATTVACSKIQSVGSVVLTRRLAQPKATVSPPRNYGRCDWLVGKRCIKNITNYNGEIILRMGSIVTLDAIVACKKSCKLVELMLSCV